jgi:hypothetical protein
MSRAMPPNRKGTLIGMIGGAFSSAVLLCAGSTQGTGRQWIGIDWADRFSRRP